MRYRLPAENKLGQVVHPMADIRHRPPFDDVWVAVGVQLAKTPGRSVEKERVRDQRNCNKH